MRAKKLLSRMIGILLVIGLLPVSVFAEFLPESAADPTVVTEPKFLVTVSHVNPEYQRLGVKFPKPAADCMTNAESAVDSIEEAAVYLREQMEQRVNEVVISVNNHTYVDNDGLVSDWLAILYGAWVHTGVPTQGDYIVRHYGSSGGGVDHDKKSVATFYFTITYDTTLEQENEVGKRIDELFEQWDEEFGFYDLSDYEQVKMIYDYICANVSYDWKNLNDNAYTLKYTAYAALINGTAVCQGYANLFYRMALGLDIDNRIVVGFGGGAYHAWNLVDMGDKYYYVDSTWDAGKTEYDYFLLGSEKFCVDHTVKATQVYDCDVADYPVDTADYVLVTEPDNVLEDAEEAGLLVYFDDVSVDDPLTRLDVAKLVAALAELPLDPDAELTYADCAELTDVEQQIIAAVESFGVLTGYSNGTFRPFETMDRSRVALALYRTLYGNVDAEDIGDYADDGYFTDVQSFTWYAPYVNYLASIGVIPVNGDNEFHPNEVADFRAALRWMVNAVQPEIIYSGTCGENLIWTLDETGLLTISGEGKMDDYESHYDIPWRSLADQIYAVRIKEGVTSIGELAFFCSDRIKNVEIADSVTSIGGSAFAGCDQLEELFIPANVTNIGERAVSSCESLVNITVDSSNEYYCSVDGVLFTRDMTLLVGYPAGKQLNLYTIPQGVTTIGGFAFEGATRLFNVAVPKGVTEIRREAFHSCIFLLNITLPDSLISIGDSAFAICSNLSGITLPENLTSIGAQAFKNCKSLVSIELPDSLTELGKEAFSFCSSLVDIKFSAKMTSISREAFSYCTALTNVEIPGNIADIGDYAFQECEALETVILCDGVENLGVSAFGSCYRLVNIALPDTLTTIGQCAFNQCGDLAEITIPVSVTEIGDRAFADCDQLMTVYYTGTKAQWEEVKIGRGNGFLLKAETICTDGAIEKPDIIDLGEHGDNLTWILTMDGHLTISGTGEMMYYYSSSLPWRDYLEQILSVEIGDGITNIAKGTFGQCTNLVSITIPDSVTSIGDSAFAGCANLVDIEIPDDVIFIGDSAFSGCASIVSIKIPSGVTGIGDHVFQDCASLADIEIPDSLIYIDNSAFSGCAGLTSIELPDVLTRIGSGAFASCTGLMSITIPGGMTNISSRAFANCTSLVSVSIGISVDTIDAYAFEGCTALATVNYAGTGEQWKKIYIGAGNEFLQNAKFTFGEVELPEDVIAVGICGDDLNWVLGNNGVLTISGTGAMSNYDIYYHLPWYDYDNQITAVEIGDGVTSIGENAFSGCDNLVSITISNSVVSIGSYAFSYCTSLNGIILPESVVSIGSHAFDHCTSLENIIIPDGVTTIGESVFAGCFELATVSIGSNVTSIGVCAFSDCFKLESIEIPESVSSIELNAFENCDNLATVYYTGTMEQWNEVEIRDGNESLMDAEIIIAHDHVEEVVPGKEPTCEEPGLTEGKKCAACGEVLVEQEEIPAKGHTEELLPGKEAAFMEPGLTEGKQCTVCGKITVKQEEIPALEGITGECGVKLKWTLTKDGILTIEGEGEMDNYAVGEDTTPASGVADALSEEEIELAPWSDYRTLIYKIVVNSGVASIGDNAFAACVSLKEIRIPGTVASIGDNVFLGCDALEKVTYTGNEEQWNEIEIGEGNESLAESEFVIVDVLLGDVNGDGKVNGTDTNLIFRHVSGTTELTGDQLKAADVNGDGKVNGTDTNLVFRYVSGTIDSLE